MAFFGLTALGPQDTFTHHAKGFVHIHVFEEEDFDTAWAAVLPRNEGLSKANLPLVLRKLFRGPIPKNDYDLVTSEFESLETIEYGVYMETLLRLKATITIREKEGQGRLQGEGPRLQDKILAPLTATQEYGWETQVLRKPVAGRAASTETKYAAELVKSGIFY